MTVDFKNTERVYFLYADKVDVVEGYTNCLSS